MSASRAVTVVSLAGLNAAIETGPHHLVADEQVDDGGTDTGPNPFDLLLSSLAACTVLTLRVYATRKGWPLGKISATLTQERGTDAHRMHVALVLDGPLDAEQHARLLDIARRCPVHRTLTGKIEIDVSG